MKLLTPLLDNGSASTTLPLPSNSVGAGGSGAVAKKEDENVGKNVCSGVE